MKCVININLALLLKIDMRGGVVEWKKDGKHCSKPSGSVPISLISPRSRVSAQKQRPKGPLPVFSTDRNRRQSVHVLELQFWNFSSSLPENYRANGEIYDKFVFSTTLIFWCFHTGVLANFYTCTYDYCVFRKFSRFEAE